MKKDKKEGEVVVEEFFIFDLIFIFNYWDNNLKNVFCAYSCSLYLIIEVS